MTKPATTPVPNAIALSIEQARAMLGVSRDKFYRMLRARELPARKCGKRTLILAADLQAYAESLPPYA